MGSTATFFPSGGDSRGVREQLSAVHSLAGTAFGAFAALKLDGSVVPWVEQGFGAWG